MGGVGSMTLPRFYRHLHKGTMVKLEVIMSAGSRRRYTEDFKRETVQLVRQTVSEGRHAYVLANNRSEGNALFPVQALSEMLRA
jgi:hypothetical protein